MRIEALVLDLDQTLVDTSCLEKHRKARDWASAKAGVSGTSAYDGVGELLTVCGRLGIKVGIVTTSPSPYARTVLGHHSLAFDVLIGFHDAKPPKPSPAPMLACSDRLGVHPSACLAVGDLPKDIVAANEAGMESVAATWGCSDRQSLVSAGPKHVAESVPELIALVQRLRV